MSLFTIISVYINKYDLVELLVIILCPFLNDAKNGFCTINV